MILLDVTDTSFGQDIMAVTNKLVIVICVGVALKIIQTLYAPVSYTHLTLPTRDQV